MGDGYPDAVKEFCDIEAHELWSHAHDRSLAELLSIPHPKPAGSPSVWLSST